ncbi:virB8 family protein [Sphingopyxis sp.]|uniref:virB8 family protein n=1 Tax=Sphingopyxis sp. TaxID=1908224 RepID=UPI0035B162A0
MNKHSREALDAYYVEADSWAKDQQDTQRKSRRMAWIIAGTAAAIALMEAIALIVLMPLKTVQPYTLLVDKTTGYVQALDPVEPEKISGDTALTQSFLVQYVIARESYDIDSLQTNYRRVGLWSAEGARAQYLNDMQASSPNSPLMLYPRNSVVETRVKSISPVSKNVTMVRFETILRDETGRAGQPRAWVAVIRYRYSGEPMQAEDRFINPLGFEVTRYRRDPETLTPDPAPANPVPPYGAPGQGTTPYPYGGAGQPFPQYRPQVPPPPQQKPAQPETKS